MGISRTGRPSGLNAVMPPLIRVATQMLSALSTARLSKRW
jgi:hypothetical protein